MSLRKLTGICGALVFFFGVVLCRVYWVCTDTAYAKSAGAQTVFETELPRARGNFYDRNANLLTGSKKRWYALCIPGDSSYAGLFPYVTFAAQSELYEKRNTTAPFLIEVEREIKGSGTYTFASAQRYLPLPIAAHLLGYLDGEGHGVAGLESAYDDILSTTYSANTIACTTSAQGRLLTGTEPQITTTEQGSGAGVELTLDANLQRACEGIALETMTRGCIVVMDTATGEVLASVSMPLFDPENIGKSIRANDTSLINRPLASFSAGSVFKVVLAAAAYRAGLDWFSYECTGGVSVGDQTFRCALGRAHGEVNLRGALEQSCNCYFVELGKLLGAQKVLQAAQDFGFGQETAVAAGLKSAAGVLPEDTALDSEAQLAMFSFGQGALTVTPLQITAMTNAIANGGLLLAPRFVRGMMDADTKTLTEKAAAAQNTRACEPATAHILQSMLVSVVEDGIGGEAAPDQGGAGGKTGTAQTGQYDEEGEEPLNYWFTGFWPAENPQYTITVLQDGTLDPEVSSAAIFARVANALFVYKSG